MWVPTRPPNVVLARPEGRDRVGLYLYDLIGEKFGDFIAEYPVYDLESAMMSRNGERVLRYCDYDHVRIREFGNKSLNAHMRACADSLMTPPMCRSTTRHKVPKR
jgi:hypothetical protein